MSSMSGVELLAHESAARAVAGDGAVGPEPGLRDRQYNADRGKPAFIKHGRVAHRRGSDERCAGRTEMAFRQSADAGAEESGLPANAAMNRRHRAVSRVVVRIVWNEGLGSAPHVDHLVDHPQLAEAKPA